MDTNVETEQRISYLEKAVGSLQERLDDQEDRSRRKNIRIIGVPESSEGTSAIYSMESWIPQILGLTTKAGNIKLERAHRVLGISRTGAEPSKPYPHVKIMRFHHYGDGARVLEAARLAKSVNFEGNRIFFFPVFSSGRTSGFWRAQEKASIDQDSDLWLKLSCESEDHREQLHQILR